ncbi:hypothetical protein EPUS_03030 [Endocarpon pusillum Z07020]|uniref:Uncharacterized protein n=1 Tax=Endocarpon pusillum (strain Z07020 / HMAS-L-300199) TaxID=1263415 RepID=U1HV37_ENDPU|nr:uncharacterized protein EPUS_03030 [Endocarpon pusillum Z07020]ERF73189.1 hypothetical protein EPUS_03030 [Endocarpon pusillum Z07020]
MSIVGISPSDILNGIGLAIQIQRTWFDRANRADSLYREFGDDIRHLSGNLEALKLAFETGYRLSVHDGRYYDPLQDALDKDRRALVGNFEATLVDCEKLLKKNVAVSREGLSFVRNSYWHISVKPTVDALRERIKFHMIKMEFVLEPLRHGLLKDISMSINLIMATMGDLHAFLIQGTPASQLRLPPIPPGLQQRFEVAFSSNQPKSFSDGSDRVIELMFDALHRTFMQSTFSYHGPLSGIQTSQQYLNLIKAQFLSEKLREARGLSERYYYDRSARLIELKIRLEFRRDNIERYREEELEVLEQGLFEIWIAHEESDSPVANVGVEVGAPSEEILVLPVIHEDGRSLQNLAVVRQNQSEVDFLLVKRTLATATSGPRTDNYPMNIHHYRYIPWYAIPTDEAASTKVEVRNTMSIHSSFFTFKDNSDVLKFQHAVMGYHVICDKTSVAWKFHSKDCGQNLIKSQNRIQLWRGKRLSARKRAEDASASDPTATMPISSRSNDTIQSPPSAQTDKPPATPTIASSVISEAESTGNERITVIKALTAPVLFIFTMLDKKYTFIHIELTPQHRLSYQSCSCDDKKPHSCASVAIRYTRKQKNLKFPFRIHSVEPSQVANFDLALFASQQHPGFSRLKSKETGYLNLDFTSSAERIHFARCFNNLLEDHRAKYNAIEQHRAQRKHQSGLSGEGEFDRSSGSWRSASFSSIGSSSTRVHSPTSPAPRLDPVPNLPELSLPYREGISP